jgi:hypothetical protein
LRGKCKEIEEEGKGDEKKNTIRMEMYEKERGWNAVKNKKKYNMDEGKIVIIWMR